MKMRNVAALAALATAGQLLVVAPASANSIQEDRRTTLLAAQLLGDASSARLALIAHNSALAATDMTSAGEVCDRMETLAKTTGASVVVPIYTELDDNAGLSDGWIGNQAPNETVAQRMKRLEVTYFAINLPRARASLDAAQRSVANNDDAAAEVSLAAIRTDLVQGDNGADLPLLVARRDLALAQHEIDAKQFASATTDLGNAADSLKGYSSAGHSLAAQQLSADIRAAAPYNGPSVSTKIDGWWSSVTTWFIQHS